MSRVWLMIFLAIILPIQLSHNIRKKETYSISNYNGSMLDSEKSILDKLLLILFFEEKNHTKKYLYYTKKYLVVTTILQVVWLIFVFFNKWYLSMSFFILHTIIVLFLFFLPCPCPLFWGFCLFCPWFWTDCLFAWLKWAMHWTNRPF